MQNKEFHPDDDERIERIVSEITSILGTEGCAQLLIDGNTEHAIEGIPEGHRALTILFNAMNDPEDGLTEVTLRNVVKDTDTIEDLESFIIISEQRAISDSTERGFGRVRVIEQRMNGLPGWVAEQLLYAELDIIQSGAYSVPQDYANELGLRQIEAKWFGSEQNRVERKKLWDGMLKFSLYRTEIHYNDGMKFIDRSWETSGAKAHNAALRRAKTQYDGNADHFMFDGAEQTVKELFMPDTDPLDDLEAFVYRW